MDLRENLYKNIYLTGGNTMIEGFKERIVKEIGQTFKSPSTSTVASGDQLKIFANSDRTTSCWKGGSILSNMNMMKNAYINEAVYKEEGDRALTKFSF